MVVGFEAGIALLEPERRCLQLERLSRFLIIRYSNSDADL